MGLISNFKEYFCPHYVNFGNTCSTYSLKKFMDYSVVAAPPLPRCTRIWFYFITHEYCSIRPSQLFFLVTYENFSFSLHSNFVLFRYTQIVFYFITLEYSFISLHTNNVLLCYTWILFVLFRFTCQYFSILLHTNIALFRETLYNYISLEVVATLGRK